MGFHDTKVRVNKGKSIGKVLYIVEGNKTEALILYYIFCKVLDYQFESILRDKGYHKYNSKENAMSQVFVINTEESNIKTIYKDNDFLNNLYITLFEKYDFNVDNAAIYYLFDRDYQSNTDVEFIKEMIDKLGNARDNEGYDRQGMLLLSYPAIESFTLSNFEQHVFEKRKQTGKELKQYLHSRHINHQNISEDSLMCAVRELWEALQKIGNLDLDLDDFRKINNKIFNFEENEMEEHKAYRILSLLCISLLDLGLLEIEENENNKSFVE